jgi:hypothetical protein
MNKKNIINYIDMLDNKIKLNKESKKVNYKKIFNAKNQDKKNNKKKDIKTDILFKIIHDKKIK